jgi:hypothetical protein
MAHTLSTLMAHSNTSIAFHARRLWDTSRNGGAPLFKVARNAAHSADAQVTLSRVEHRDAWIALRAYARRALLPAFGKFGVIVVNGEPRMISQSGDRLTVDMASIGCTRACGNGKFRA